MTTPTRPTRGATDLDIVRASLDQEYEVLRELGRGGMAIVYEAREVTLDRMVALKVLPFTLAHDEALVERFQREARTAAQLEHPHIIPIHRVGRVEQVIYFAMKLLRGLSLGDRLLEQGRLSPAETRRVLAETAGALGHAHRHGVVHRDVKPDNILLDEDGRCIVTDFGIARSAADSALTAAGTSLGTPRYMSPEQARAHPVDGRSDIYSLGIVGYQCLTGRLPFDGDDMMAIMLAQVTTPVPRPQGMGAEEAAVYAIIERMLAKNPADRFQSGEEAAAALAGASLPSGGRPVTHTGPVVAADAGIVAPRYGTVGAAPESSAALDRALDAGVGILRQQRPRVDAGIEAGRRIVGQQAPKLWSAADRLAERLHAGIQRTRALAARDPRRFWSVLAGVTVLAVGVPTVWHFAANHRSRCPASAPGDGAASTGAFTLLVDDGRSARAGGDAEVYYDVCGLEKGTSYSTRVVLTKQQSGFQKLVGGTVAPIAETFQETARGPATRRHRSFDMSGMPAGSYTLSVRVTDAKGRRRAEAVNFRMGR